MIKNNGNKILYILCILLIYLNCGINVFGADQEQQFLWPLIQNSSSIVLRPGYRINPKYKNSLTNLDYYLTGQKDALVYAPVSGTINDCEDYYILFPSGKEILSFSTINDLSNLSIKLNDPILNINNATRGLSISMKDGRNLFIYGLKTIIVKKGDYVNAGDPIGSLGYIPTFFDEPCLKLSLSGSNKHTDSNLGILLANEDNSDFFSELKKNNSLIYNPQKQLTESQIQEAWAIFKAAINLDHPGLIDKEKSIKFNIALSGIESKLKTTLQVGHFRTYLQEAISTISCSHTKIKPFDTSYRSGSFPFLLTLHNGKCYVVFDKREKKLPVGTLVQEINGIAIETWIKNFYPLINCDSQDPIVINEYLNRNFSFLIETYMNVSEKLSISYLDNKGKLVREPYSILTTSQMNNIKWPESIDKETKTVTYINNRTAILKLWSIDQAASKDEFLNYFKDFNNKNVENLIIDLRGNQGGENDNLSYLYSFFALKKFKTYESMEIRHQGVYHSFKNSINLFYGNNEVHSLIFTDFQEAINGRYILNNNDYINPSERYSFKGKIYILVDVYTVSAAVNLARLLRQNNNAVIFGTESSGGYYSCNAYKENTILLGSTGLTLTMPLFQIIFTTDRDKNIPLHRGIIPDHYIRSSLEDELYGTDSQLNYVLTMVDK